MSRADFPERQPEDGDVAWKGKSFSVILKRVRYDDGSFHVHEQIESPDVVRVYPLIEPDTIRLIREYRHDVDDWVIRVPAGRVKPGESPEQAAARELREEVGLEAGALRLLRNSQPVLKFKYSVWHFVASDVVNVGATPEYGERIEPFDWPIRQLADLVFGGRIPEDSLALSLLHIARECAARREGQ
jgi:ADP-ribose pyrophosphatase